MDYYKYDDCSRDKSDTYIYINNPNNSSITLQNGYYNLSYSRTPESNSVQLKIAELTSTDFEVSVDIQYNYSGSHQHGLYMNDGSNDAMACCWSSQKVVGAWLNGNDIRTKTSPILSTNVWYTHKLKVQNGTLTSQILDSNGSIVTEKQVSGWVNSTNIIRIQVSEYITRLWFKNVKIRTL